MARTISIGAQDFEYIRKNQYFYVDKTEFIREWWESGDVLTLITRPRRFGKTLNMRMTEQFFSIQYRGRHDLFEGLNIWGYEEYRQLQGTWPVMFLSFAGIKGESYEAARNAVIQRIVDLYAKFQFLREGDSLNPEEKKYFEYVSTDMSEEMAVMALHRLSICMERYYGKKVLILLDEYDTPLQEAYVSGYWERLTGFIRNLFNNTFKTNPYMERGILTGITRVSTPQASLGKESVFSDMNNLAVITTTSERYKTCFGFTEDEVVQALEQYGLSDSKTAVEEWYDGFNFGSCKGIYNPWSIISFLKEKKFKAYWANTSENSLVNSLIRQGSPQIKMTMEDLLEGKSFTEEIDEEIVFSQLNRKKDSGRSYPERFYHGFVLWLIVELTGEYRVTSNRESGFGRYDVMLEPLKPGKPAFVLEFKVRRAEESSLEETVKRALKQIEEKGYDAELMARGIPKEQIRHYGFAFEGKTVLIGG